MSEGRLLLLVLKREAAVGSCFWVIREDEGVGGERLAHSDLVFVLIPCVMDVFVDLAIIRRATAYLGMRCIFVVPGGLILRHPSRIHSIISFKNVLKAIGKAALLDGLGCLFHLSQQVDVLFNVFGLDLLSILQAVEIVRIRINTREMLR